MYVIYSDGSGRRRRLGRIDEAFFPRRAFRTITRTIAFFILLFVFFFLTRRNKKRMFIKYVYI